MNEEKYFFERKVYSKMHKFKFKEDKSLIKTLGEYKKEGKILDLGCGEAGTSLKLSESGFNVTCIDLSKAAISAVKAEVKRRKLNLKAVCADLEKYRIKNKYDVVLFNGILHFLLKKRCLNLIDELKKKTSLNGLNVLDVFLQGSRCQKGSKGHYFVKNELLQLYSGWKVVQRKVYKDNEGNINEFVIFQKIKV